MPREQPCNNNDYPFVLLTEDNIFQVLKAQIRSKKRIEIFESQTKSLHKKELLDMVYRKCDFTTEQKISHIDYGTQKLAELEKIKKTSKELSDNERWNSKDIYAKIEYLTDDIYNYCSNPGFVVISKSPKRLFCRPLCPSRHSKAEEMDFPVSIHQAFFKYNTTPCGRCLPMAANYLPALAKLIKAFNCMRKENWRATLDQLAGEAELSKHHFDRNFKTIFAEPPGKFQKNMRKFLRLDKSSRSGNSREVKGENLGYKGTSDSEKVTTGIGNSSLIDAGKLYVSRGSYLKDDLNVCHQSAVDELANIHFHSCLDIPLSDRIDTTGTANILSSLSSFPDSLPLAEFENWGGNVQISPPDPIHVNRTNLNDLSFIELSVEEFFNFLGTCVESTIQKYPKIA